MNETRTTQLAPDPTFKDSVACGAVLASMLLTMACGAFVVDAGTDPSPHYAQAAGESHHE